MIEGTPAKPFGDSMNDFIKLEDNIHLRRQQIKDLLDDDEFCFSLASFPLLGCKNCTYPSYKITIPPNFAEGVFSSYFLPDEIIYNLHPRYKNVAENIRKRRRSKVIINVPIYFDQNTPRPFNEDLRDLNNGENIQQQKEDHVYLDCVGFGMGCSSLQVTFQAQSLNEARHLYDQLESLTPILLALSAASPIWRGYLCDIDTRWSVISASADDRTPEELNENKLNKSRYDTIDCYLSPDGSKYNDSKFVINEEAYKTLIENNIDNQLAQHISHLFVRDPLCLFKEKLEDDEDCFENIQSTNWQSLRFKPPPSNSPIGWRVEFRVMDLQITDFENVAFVTFLVLLTRVILSFKLNLLIPISKIDENMKNAQKRDACRQEKFYFRTKLFHLTHLHDAEYKSKHHISSNQDEENEDINSVYSLMTINDIINGSEGFPGLIPLINVN
jgi:glutamate--cysteine ligase catalytic subunit